MDNMDISFAFEDDDDHPSSLLKPSTTTLMVLAIPAVTLAAFKNVEWKLIIEALQSSTAFYVSLLSVIGLLALAFHFQNAIKSAAAFVYGCFFKKIDGETQSERLESFYATQAEVYDRTRSRLLGGRVDMLRVCASQLKFAVEGRSLSKMKQELVWVDIGGGTGWNIEQMNEHFPIGDFKKVYLIDLCPSLCNTARNRFTSLGWENVEVLCADACAAGNDITKIIPEGEDSAALVTFSYSLSMIPNFYAAVDFAKKLVNQNGFLGIVDFGVSDKTDPADRKYSWIMRWFWQIWFDFDHVNLHSSRRKYVEHVFNRIKDFTGKNMKMFGAPLPFYIYLGTKTPQEEQQQELTSEWRFKFDETQKSPWNTYMYAFAWEDPAVDLQYMDLNPNDNVLAITSGGCNILEYVLSGAKNVWGVDMNPAQNDILELKLAMLRSPYVNYDNFWKMFGTGRFENFSEFLDLYLSPYMSPRAYRFWKKNAKTFEKTGFYNTGHSGSGIVLARRMTAIFGIGDLIKQFCTERDITKSFDLWSKRIAPVLFPRWFISLVLNRKRFMWNALGVPKKQMKLLLNEFDGDLGKCIMETFDPVAARGILPSENYFYYLCLLGEYSQECCPSYLKPDNYLALRSHKNLKNVRINTKKFIEVLRAGGPDGEKFTKVVLMDHMDWFNAAQAEEQVEALWNAVEAGGKIFWRSAEQVPWYNSVFKRRGFFVQQIHVRKAGDFIDRVNMYLSFNVATKPVVL
eukprot:TRINITY_DN1283_c0_g1_i1.p1 TRINITY_DN1283_c0_g1~~TRINITY_DN1283_c0_g1_i1.p1  ORF type:complete len:741 (+),score=247.55 TRINITY_DN1283_c0_g1_i1:43-2265(+)